jgi:acyl carrier protein
MRLAEVERDTIAQSIRAILAGLIKRDIDVHVDLTVCGMNSLMVTQLISRIRDLYQVELSIIYIFEMETPTIAALSDYIAMLRWCGRSDEEPVSANPKDLTL